MILRISAVQVIGSHLLDLKFNDGTEKTVDVLPLLSGPVFEPLLAVEYFALAKLDRTCGTVIWPDGADFAPEALYELADVKADVQT